MEKGEIAQMSNFTFSHKVFYAICIFKSFNSHISVVVCTFFEFWTVSKWCILERAKQEHFQTASGDQEKFSCGKRKFGLLFITTTVDYSKLRAFGDKNYNKFFDLYTQIFAVESFI